MSKTNHKEIKWSLISATKIQAGKIKMSINWNPINKEDGNSNDLIPEFEANVKLIAAAPEILQALIDLEDFSSRNHPDGFKYSKEKHNQVLKQAFEAINKVTT